MDKKVEVRKRIKKVMGDIGSEDQAAFSKLLGFRPSTVSAWMTGASLPSPEAYMVLGAKAQDIEDSLFFWQRARVSKDAILSASRKVIGAGLAPEREGETVRLRPYNRRSEEDFGPGLILPSNMVPNPGSTYFMRLGKAAPEQFFFGAGDILVLDTTDAPSRYVKPFFGYVVAVGREDWPLLGRLWLAKIGRHFEADLTPVGGLAAPRTTLTIADYEVPPAVPEDEASDEAFERMQQSPALPILGRLVAYLPGEPTARIF